MMMARDEYLPQHRVQPPMPSASRLPSQQQLWPPPANYLWQWWRQPAGMLATQRPQISTAPQPSPCWESPQQPGLARIFWQPEPWIPCTSPDPPAIPCRTDNAAPDPCAAPS